MSEPDPRACSPVEISNDDIIAAMRAMEGYVDITPADFREVYRVAYVNAVDRVLTSLTARDVMTRPVVSFSSDEDLVRVAERLAEKKISGAPVTDSSGKVVGVISEKDFLRHLGDGRSFMGIIAQCLRNQGCLAVSIRHQKAADIMTSPAVTAAESTSVRDLSRILSERGINRIPVVDDAGTPVGMITRTDLMNAFCRIE